jgi:hypothetical protein
MPNIHTYRYIHSNTYVHLFIHLRTHIHAQVHTDTFIHAYMLTCIHAHMHACVHACIHTYIRVKYIHTYIHTYINTYIHTCMHACTHAHIQIYIYTYIYIYIYICTHKHIRMRVLFRPNTCSYANSIANKRAYSSKCCNSSCGRGHVPSLFIRRTLLIITSLELLDTMFARAAPDILTT